MVKRNENMLVIIINYSEKIQVRLKIKQNLVLFLFIESIFEILGYRKVESKRKSKYIR